jgi:DNA-binding response OmpR family regulator
VNNEVLDFSVLFVEDDIEVKNRVSGSLRVYFRDVYEAQDGKEGLELYYKHKPDILFLDINLPKLSGLEMLKKIRETDPVTKAVMLTAHSETEVLLQSIDLKISKYIIKPLNRKTLKQTVEMLANEMKSYTVIPQKHLQLKDEFSWNRELEILLHKNTEIPLTPNEKKVLKLLAKNPDRIFSYDDIIIFIWDSFDDKQNPLRTIIKNLRKKLPDGTIVSVYGQGLKLRI